MPTYEVRSNLQHGTGGEDGEVKDYGPGTDNNTIELSEEEAAPLIQAGVLLPQDTHGDVSEQNDRIAELEEKLGEARRELATARSERDQALAKAAEGTTKRRRGDRGSSRYDSPAPNAVADPDADEAQGEGADAQAEAEAEGQKKGSKSKE